MFKNECVATVLMGAPCFDFDFPTNLPARTCIVEIKRRITWVDQLELPLFTDDVCVRYDEEIYDWEDCVRFVHHKQEILEEWRELLHNAEEFPEATIENV